MLHLTSDGIEIKKCPECNASFQVYERYNTAQNAFWIECHKCGAHTARCTDRKTAIWHWNIWMRPWCTEEKLAQTRRYLQTLSFSH